MRNNAADDAASFVRTEEEGFVFPDRTAQRAPKLILFEGGFRGWAESKAMSVQNVIAEEFVSAAVEIVCTRLGDDVDDGAGVAAVLGVKGIGDDAKFFNAIGRGLNRGEIGEEVVAVAAVYGVVVGAASSTVHSDNARFVRAIKEIVSDLGLNARLQLQELEDVARVQGQLRRRALVDDGSQLRRCRIHNRRRAGDFHYLGRSADLQREINAYHLVKIEDNSLAGVFLEALAGGIDLVTPHRYFQEDVFSIRTTLDVTCGMVRLVD